MGYLELALIGVGLSMDAFAVSVCKGLSMRKVDKKYMFVPASTPEILQKTDRSQTPASYLPCASQDLCRSTLQTHPSKDPLQ